MITPIPSSLLGDRVYRTRSHSNGAAASYVVSAAPAILESLLVTNASSNARFLQIHDAAALPDDDTVPILSIPIAASGTVNLPDLSVYGETGIVVAMSTTLATLTISADTALFYATTRS